MIQMISVDDSWVATVGRPPQLAFALSQVVRALLGCSWAVLPIHLSFCACPQTQTATATKKIPSLREAIESKDHITHLRATSFFRLHASHLCANTLVATQSPALTQHTALGIDLAHSLACGCNTLEGVDESPADLPHSCFASFPLSCLSEDGACCRG